MPFAATWMDLEIIILSEVSQTENITRYCLYVESKKKKKDTDKLIHKNRNRPTDTENKLTVAKRKGWGSDKLGVWD